MSHTQIEVTGFGPAATHPEQLLIWCRRPMVKLDLTGFPTAGYEDGLMFDYQHQSRLCLLKVEWDPMDQVLCGISVHTLGLGRFAP